VADAKRKTSCATADLKNKLLFERRKEFAERYKSRTFTFTSLQRDKNLVHYQIYKSELKMARAVIKDAVRRSLQKRGRNNDSKNTI